MVHSLRHSPVGAGGACKPLLLLMSSGGQQRGRRSDHRRDALRQAAAGRTLAVHLERRHHVRGRGSDVLFVQHSTGASRIERTTSASGLVPGDHVAVSGQTSLPHSTTLPIVSQATFTKLAANQPPRPQVLQPGGPSHRRLRWTLGRDEGTIAAARAGAASCASSWRRAATGSRCRVLDYPLIQLRGLVGARVTALGVCMPSPGCRSKVADFRLVVSRFPDLRLSEATHAAIELSGDRPLLTTVNTIRNLSSAEAARHLPGPHQRRRDLCGQGMADAVRAGFDGRDLCGYPQGSLDMSAGDLVDVQGWSDPGNYAPEIIRPTITRRAVVRCRRPGR